MSTEMAPTIGLDAKRIVRNRTGLGSYGRTLVNALAALDNGCQWRLYAPDRGHADLVRQVEPRPNISFSYPSFVSCPEPRHASAGEQLAADQQQPSADQRQTLSDHQPSSPGIVNRLRGDYWRVKGVVEDLKRDGVKLYHGLSGELPAGLKRSGIRGIVTIHDLIFLRHPEYYHWLDTKIYHYKFLRTLREADRIIAISECTKRDILHFGNFPEDKISVIYQSCGTRFSQSVAESKMQEVHARYNLPVRYVLNVGTIEARKNVGLAIEALTLLPDDLHLVVVGRLTAYHKTLEKLFGQHPRVRARVHILNNVPNDDLPAIYQMAETFVYPSRYEGFGIPIIEAIQSGLPVVAATGSCLEEAGGPHCLYVDPDDATAMASAIEQSIAERDGRVALSREYVRRFENQDVAQQVMNEYLKLL